jgi:tetratricopeptide (TPR) repeat protein
MRNVSKVACFALLATALASPSQAMAPLLDEGNPDIAAFNAVVERQNAAFAAGDVDSALELNAKLIEMAEPLLAERPSTKGMIDYDRAVMLIRKGETEAGLSLLDASYALGDLTSIGKANLPVDYYGTVMKTYIDALRQAGRPEWREVQGVFLNDLFEGASAQTMWIATWTNVAMVNLTDAGFVSEAGEVCRRQIAWFEANPSAAKPSGFAAIGRPSVFVSDSKEPGFVTGLALRTGRYESSYAFLRADLEDTCGGIMEATGDLDSAVAHRRSSLDWIRQQDDVSYVRLIQLRLGRLMAYQGNDSSASQYLSLALDGYRRNVNGGDIAGEVCSQLPFVLEGQPSSAADVMRKFREGPLTKAVVEGLDC